MRLSRNILHDRLWKERCERATFGGIRDSAEVFCRHLFEGPNSLSFSSRRRSRNAVVASGVARSHPPGTRRNRAPRSIRPGCEWTARHHGAPPVIPRCPAEPPNETQRGIGTSGRRDDGKLGWTEAADRVRSPAGTPEQDSDLIRDLAHLLLGGLRDLALCLGANTTQASGSCRRNASDPISRARRESPRGRMPRRVEAFLPS